ncbi:Brefeldin A-inhibited guanine nucleotide-exchange protein 2 [Rhizoclosmatium sp. JEL0117]|nr:Brefeldin A-inhibited guanine nucleotide-exchange protein 2 [Rhizoclosmatium sp. JEL0117]
MRGATRIDADLLTSTALVNSTATATATATPSSTSTSTSNQQSTVEFLFSFVTTAAPTTAAATPTTTQQQQQRINSFDASNLNNLDVSSPHASLSHLPNSTSSSVSNNHNHNQKKESAFLIDDIIHCVCACFSLNDADANVHLQVLKVLLTAVTATSTCQVHSASLLKCVQTCFNIHLHSKNPGNAVTAKAALTQMVHAVFSRMERYSEVLERNKQLVTADTPLLFSGTSSDSPVASVVQDGGNSAETASKDGASVAAAPSRSPSPHPTSPLPPNTTIRSPSPTPVSESAPPATSTSRPISPVPDNSKLNPSAVPSRVVGMFDDDVSAAVSASENDDIDDTTQDSIDPNADQVKPISNHPPPTSNNASPQQQHREPHLPTPYDPTIAYYNSLLKKDAYLVLRLLCRLSTQTDAGLNATAPTSASTTFTIAAVTAAASLPSDDVSPQTAKARSLALEMILSILNNAGHVLQTEEMYSDLVKSTLAASISRNAVTTNPVLFEFSLSIFLMVIRYYRARMKVEVEVLLNTVYLHILEMGNSTYKQKSLVLQALQKVCETPQTLVDVYVNYDCDLQCVSLFERILSACTRVAQGKDGVLGFGSGSGSGVGGGGGVGGGVMGLLGSAGEFVSGTGAAGKEVVRVQEGRLKLRGVCCLVGVVGSLVVWGGCEGKALAAGKEEVGKKSSSTEEVAGGDGSDEAVNTRSGSPVRKLNGTAVGSVDSPNAAKLLLDALSSDSPVVLNKNRLQNVTIGTKAGKEAVGSISNVSGGAAAQGSSSPQVGAGMPGTPQQERMSSVDDEDTRGSIEAIAQRKTLMKQGIKLFDEKPVKAIKFFRNHDFIPALRCEKDDATEEDDDAYSVATFLKSTSGLSKSGIGSYLGEMDPFCIKVMHMFVDSLDFAGVGIVDALRMFLQTFRLPGEAQKIDRLMEKFADRYCETNPDVFAKADTAYTLAFSIIMLNTDAHSPQIKNKMDKAGFLKNNRGINDNGDLPNEYLEAIFDDIHNNEIIMEDEQTGKFAQMVQGWGAAELSDKERMELYRKEVAQIQKKSQQLLASSGNEQNLAPFRSAVQADLARPMFATACWPLIATFSQLFESVGSNDSYSNDDLDGSLIDISDSSKKEEVSVVDLCLDGFAGGIKIASTFKMEMEREAFVTSLSKLTGLSHFRDFKPKNVKAIKTLLGLTLSFAEHLDSSWLHVIKIISQMERLQLLGARGASLDSSRPDDLIRANPNVEKFLSEFSSQDTIVTVDRIFTGTTSMTGPAILQFFKAVCAVSLEEVGIDPISLTRIINMQGSPDHGDVIVSPVLTPQSLVSAGKVTTGIVTTNKTDGPPRMYLLQKIVEIAHYNMHRIRFEWSQIWRVLQPHFVVVACHPNVRVASFAVDALRQLSMKFLEREELVHFSTQNEFLKSFERIMKLTMDDSIRHMVLGSLGQMITARSGSIRSGWKPIFVVLSRPTFMISSSNDFDELLLESFQLLQTIFREYFSIVVHAGGLLEFINCVADFALLDPVRQTHDDIIIQSIQLLQLSASQIVQIAEDEVMQVKLKGGDTHAHAGPKQPLAVQTAASSSHMHPNPPTRLVSQPFLLPNGLISEEHFFLKWFPIFSAFSRITMGSNNLTVRTKCIESLFEVLSQCIHMFDLKCVRSIYRSAILPIFDDLKEQFDKMETGSTEDFGGSNSGAETTPKQGSATIWILGLRLTIDLFSENFDKISSDPDTISSILDIALSMMKRRDQTLVATGQICLHQFIQQNVSKFGRAGVWPTIVDSIEKAFRMTNPYELVNCDFSSMKHLPDPPASMVMNTGALGGIGTNAVQVLKEVVEEGTETAKAHGAFVSLESLDFNQTVLKCSVHIELLQSIRDSILTPLVVDVSEGSEGPVVDGQENVEGTGNKKVLAVTQIPVVDRERLLTCIRESYTVARTFNANYHLRYSIWKKRLVQQLPNLIKQETISLASHVKILFGIYRAEGDVDEEAGGVWSERGEQEKEWARRNVEMLVTETVDVMERYVMMLGDAQVNGTNIGLWSPVVVLVFRELLGMDCWWKSGGVGGSRGKEGKEVLKEAGGPKCLVLKKQLPRLFRLGIRMMGVDRVDVRQALQGFIEKVGEELFFDMF